MDEAQRALTEMEERGDVIGDVIVFVWGLEGRKREGVDGLSRINEFDGRCMCAMCPIGGMIGRAHV